LLIPCWQKFNTVIVNTSEILPKGAVQ